MKKLAAISAISIFLSACSAKPTVVEVSQASDFKLNCDQLQSQIQEAERYKRDARADDEFKFKYIWLPTGVISAYNINKAEGAAKERIEALQNLSARKNCGSAVSAQGLKEKYEQRRMEVPAPVPSNPMPR